MLGDFNIEKEEKETRPTFREYREQWLKTYVEAHCKYSEHPGAAS